MKLKNACTLLAQIIFISNSIWYFPHNSRKLLQFKWIDIYKTRIKYFTNYWLTNTLFLPYQTSSSTQSPQVCPSSCQNNKRLPWVLLEWWPWHTRYRETMPHTLYSLAHQKSSCSKLHSVLHGRLKSGKGWCQILV